MNKMDRIGADFFGSMKDVQEKFGVECLALQIPIGEGQAFEGVIDLLRMKELRWNADDEGETIVESDIDESRMADAVTCTFLILDFLALIGAIFLLVWTHVNYYPPFKTAKNRYEEFLQEQKLAA